MRTSLRYSVPLLFATLCVLIVLQSCTNPEGSLNPNSPPETRLANVPANDTTAIYLTQGVIPEMVLFWAGDDPDGYVISFRYTWTTFYHGNIIRKDSVNLLNLATIGGTALDTLVAVSELARRTPGATFRIYNYLATLDPDDPATKDRIFDSLATLRPFLVPYPSGLIATDIIFGLDPLNNEAPTKGIFIFDSPADSNMHRFQVWAIDNSEVADPTPATTNFWTLPSPGLTVSITGGPTTATNAFVLRYPTERNPGLTFTFAAVDPSTNERDYSWSVDDTLHWSRWDPEPSAVVSAASFQETGSDTHTFFLRGRNRWGVISPVVSRQFTASIPAIDDPNWPRKTLIINNCRILGPGIPAVWMPAVDTTSVNNFYKEVMDSLGRQFGADYDIWTTASHATPTDYLFPSRLTLSQYTSVVLLSEQELPVLGAGAQGKIRQPKQDILAEYLNIGGKLIMSSSPAILRTMTPYHGFADEFFHVLTDSSQPPLPFLQNETYDFIGTFGRLGYPNLTIDSAKVANFPADADYAIKNIALNYPRGFGQTIYEFNSKADSSLFERSPLSVRYLAPPAIPPARQTYSLVYFGFPLYYMEKSGVISAMRKAFEDIQE
jgi:hypothetical protein